MKPHYLVLIWGLALAVLVAPACVPINKSIFDPKTPLRSRVLPLEIHIMDPNLEGNLKSGDDPKLLLPPIRIIEARYIIKKDFSRNVFEPGDQRWGHLVVRVGRKASNNWAWFVASTCTLYTVNLLGIPVYHQTSEVTLDIEILDAQRRHVTRLTAKGTGSEYCALYWGRPMSGWLHLAEDAPDFSGAQMVQAEAIRAALDDAKRQLETQANEINARLRGEKSS